MLKKLSTMLLTTSISFVSHAHVEAHSEPASISLEQVTKDVTFLASDDLKGRGNFSTEIKEAANYIAMRFGDSGLIAAKGNPKGKQNFLQTYKVTTITPSTLSVTLNGDLIVATDTSMVSAFTNLAWSFNADSNVTNSSFTLQTIGKDDDIRAALTQLNKQGGQHLVLINPNHKDLFKRFQHKFQRGVTKLTHNKNALGGAIVMVLTEITKQQVVDVNIRGTNTVKTTELSNVVAILPGKSKPEEIVLYSAHYDHLGEKASTKDDTDSKADTVYNGANDDASGTAAIINLAEYFAKQGDNARTLMFAAFSAEELGGFGSRYFSQQLDPNHITAMVNIEMIGKPSKFGAGTLWMTGMDRSDLGKQLNIALEKSTMKIYADPYPKFGLFYRSDNASLARLGVPAHSFSSTQIDKDKDYHQVSDDVSSLDLPSMHKVIQAIAIATQPLVDGTVTPSRIEVNKVKAKGLIY